MRRAIEEYLEAHPAFAVYQGRHEYDGADFGLNTADLREQFRYYTERFDVPLGKD
jgi:hypothetical protein